MSVVEAVSKVLESMGARYALIGARAVGARGHPRMTKFSRTRTTAAPFRAFLKRRLGVNLTESA
jgi:hypothetical protein